MDFPKIEKVEAFRTPDGQVHATVEAAQAHLLVQKREQIKATLASWIDSSEEYYTPDYTHALTSDTLPGFLLRHRQLVIDFFLAHPES